MQDKIVSTQCFYFPKMRKEAESGHKIVDVMIWELFQYKSCATINCAPNTLKILNSWTKKPKLKTAENVVVPCIDDWNISITCLLHLWKDLHYNGFKFLLTNWLNQDCPENIFSIIRGKGGFRGNPDLQQFRAAFKHVIIDKLFVHSTSKIVHWMQIKYS